MDDVVEGAVGTESPAVETGTESSAGTQNTGSQVNGQPLLAEHRIPYERFQQVVQRARQHEAMARQHGQTIQELQQRLARFEQAGQRPAPDPVMQSAAQALRSVLAADPELKELLGAGNLRQVVQQLQQTMQGVQSSQSRNMVQTVRSEIGQLAKTASLPTSDKALRAYEELIASEIRESPELLDRLRQGDLAVVREAFAAVQASVGEFRRSDAVATTQTKNATRALPPRSSGGTAAPPGTPASVMKPGQDATGFRRDMHKGAREALRSLFEG